MVQYRVPMQIAYNREAGDGSGMQPPDALGCSVLVGTPAFNGAAFNIIFDIPRDSVIVRCQLFFEGNDLEAVYDSGLGRSSWVLSGTGPTDLFVANGGVVFSNDSRNVVTVGGAAAALVTGDTALQAFAFYKRGPNGGVGIASVPTQGSSQPQYSSALVGAFADDAQGDVPTLGNVAATLAREELRLAGRGGGGTSVVQAGLPAPLAVRQCDAAYTDPWGRVLLTPADIGAGPGQIPTVRRDWLASQFENHPQTFVRRSNAVRGIGAATRFSFTDLTPLTGTPAVMRLYQVVRAPTHSTWLFVVDGQPQTITFAHPAGSDLRRPVDIWNAVVVPAFQASANVGGPGTPAGSALGVTPALSWEVDPGSGLFPVAAPVYPAVAFRARGGLPRRLGFSTYARCLDLWDALSPYGDPIYTEVATTDV